MGAVEIHITRLVGKSKLGQNKEQRDIEGAARGLKDQGHDEIGHAMKASRGEGRNDRGGVKCSPDDPHARCS